MKVILSIVVSLCCLAVAFGDEDSTTLPPPTPSNWFKCPDVGAYPNPYDCSKYFICIRRPADEQLIAWAMHCPGALWYNPDKGLCDFKSEVNCQAVSTASP